MCVLAFLWEVSHTERQQMRLLFRAGVVPAKTAQVFDNPSILLEEPVLSLRVWFLPFVLSLFLHGGWLHLIGNMWFLWVFGDNVEDRLGRPRYLLFYLLCGIVASLMHVLFNLESKVPTIGASGAIAGILGAYLLLYPRARVVALVPLFFFFTTVQVPAVLFLGIWFLFQWFGASQSRFVFQDAGGVAYWAHVGGFLAGMALLWILAPPRRPPRATYEIR